MLFAVQCAVFSALSCAKKMVCLERSTLYFILISCSVLQTLQNQDLEHHSTDTVLESPPASPAQRLPRNLRPWHYFVRILPHEMGNSTFEGYVEIELEVMQTTSDIVLHVSNLTLDHESIKVKRNVSNGVEEELSIVDHSLYPEVQMMAFTVNEPLNVGETVIFSVKYLGYIVSNSIGLNQLEYTNDLGSNKRIVATYLQPTGAREVFPCLDEPDLKARFTLKVGRQPGEQVLSNMEFSRITHESDRSVTWVEFQKSVPMSPYLVAFVISDFRSIQRNAGGRRKVRVWARRETLPKVIYAADLSTRVLRWYETYLGVEFPLPKLDIVTLPAYSVPGMENFGLIISKEDSLTTNSKMARLEWVSTVTAHEVAHHWAGNLVTPKWWSEFWLSEGFATYLAALALDQTAPWLEATNHLIVRELQWIRRSDFGERAMSLILHNFDPLLNKLKIVQVYYKGASVLRMMSAVIGEATFTKALQGYFRKYQFSSASQDDFVNELVKATDNVTLSALPTSLQNILFTWTEVKSYPLVTVQRNPDGSMKVRQEKFVDYISPKGQFLPQPNGSLWWVPVSFASSSYPDFSDMKPELWIPPTDDWVALSGVSSEDSWVVLNVQQVANLRVNYDEKTWTAISKQLFENHSAIHVLNRAQLIDDAFNLFTSGHAAAKVPFELISYIGKDRSFYSFKSAFDNLEKIELLLRNEPSYNLLQRYLLSLISPALFQHFSEGHMDRKLRNHLLSWACLLRQPQCLLLAQHNFQVWKQNFDDSIFPEYAMESFLCAAVEQATESDWNIVFKQMLIRLKSSSDSTDHLLKALPCTRIEEVIFRYMAYVTDSSSNMTLSVALDIFNSLARSHRWNDISWRYLRSNWDTIRKRFKNGAPVPFVNTNRDLHHLKLFLSDRLSEGTLLNEQVDYFLQDSEDHAKANTKIITGVSAWLETLESHSSP